LRVADASVTRADKRIGLHSPFAFDVEQAARLAAEGCTRGHADASVIHHPDGRRFEGVLDGQHARRARMNPAAPADASTAKKGRPLCLMAMVVELAIGSAALPDRDGC
jgi:hypothetical protein